MVLKQTCLPRLTNHQFGQSVLQIPVCSVADYTRLSKMQYSLVDLIVSLHWLTMAGAECHVLAPIQATQTSFDSRHNMTALA